MLRLCCTSLLIFIFLIPSVLVATNTTVSNANDSGAGSLRQAITEINTVADGSNNITVNGPFALSLSSNLPTLGFASSLLNTQFTLPSAFLNFTIGSIALTFDQTGTSIFNGAITGDGSVVKAGTNTLTLSGSSTYTGGTTLSAGVLTISQDGNLGAASGGLTFGAGTLKVANASFSSARTLTLTGSGTVEIDTGTTTLSGVISGGGGLTKSGSGTLILSGANTYTGGTTVSSGTLQGNATSLQGDITNNAALVFNQTAPGTYAGVISGGGSVTKTGADSLILSGANTYTGGTTVSSGTLQGNSTSLQGNIINNAFVLFNQTAALGTYAGVLSGSGSLTKTGLQTLILSGANTYSGGTAVIEGTLQGDATSLQGNIINNAALVFNQAAVLGTYSGIVSGSGSLTKTGAATLILSGANTYSGGTTVSAGTLQGNSTSLQGNISNSASVIFDQGFNGAYAGNLTGLTGTLRKTGSGNLSLSGANSALSTTVAAGRLLVNGTLISPVTVNAAGGLGGVGVITGNVTNSGVLAPGASIGTLTIIGNYTQEVGSSFEDEITPLASDLLTMTGTMTINGGTVILSPLNIGTRYRSGLLYTFSHADGGVSGAFNALRIVNDLPLFVGTLNYLPNDVQLALQMLPFVQVVKKGNPGAVARYLDTLNPPTGSDLDFIMANLQALPLKELKAALNQLQPALYKGLVISQENNASLLSAALRERQEALYKGSCITCDDEKRCRYAVWTDTYGDFFTLRGEKRFVGWSAKTFSLLLGADYLLRKHLLLGLLSAYTNSSLAWHHSAGRGGINSYYGGVYGSYFQKRYFVDASVIAAANRYEASRKMQFANVNRTARTTHGGESLIAHLNGGGIFHYEELEMRPFLSLDYLTLREERFSERGARSVNLKVNAVSTEMARSELGLKCSNCYEWDETKQLIPQWKVSWIYENRIEGNDYTAAFKGSGGSFKVDGLHPNQSLLAVGFGVTMLFAEGKCSLSANYDGEFGKNRKENRARIEFIYKF